MFSWTKVRLLTCWNHAEIFDTFSLVFLLCYTDFLQKRWKLTLQALIQPILSYWNKNLYMKLCYRQGSATMFFSHMRSCANGLHLCSMCSVHLKAIIEWGLLWSCHQFPAYKSPKCIRFCANSRNWEYSLVFWKLLG